jgi:hypothetical protein
LVFPDVGEFRRDRLQFLDERVTRIAASAFRPVVDDLNLVSSSGAKLEVRVPQLLHLPPMITSSAPPSGVSGTVRPSALDALRTLCLGGVTRWRPTDHILPGEKQQDRCRPTG